MGNFSNIQGLNFDPIKHMNLSSSFDNSQFLNMDSGLYAIGCNTTGKVYFGESDNVVYRLGNHFKYLVRQMHECRELQDDRILYGEANFSFISLSVGPQWKNTTVRRNAETKLVTLNQNKIYNQSIGGSTPKKKSDIYAKVVSYKGVVYGSISAASRKTGVSGTHIRRLISDPQNTDWTYVGDPNILEESNIVNIKKSKPIMVHNVVYRSIRNASLSTGIK